MKTWYTYEELRTELLKVNTRLEQISIIEALDYMEEHGHDEADFGINGTFIFSRKKEIKQ